MFKLVRSNGSLIVLSGLLALITVGCSGENITKVSNSNSTTTPAAVNSTNSPSKSSTSTNKPAALQKNHKQVTISEVNDKNYQLALDKAESAINISQSAQSPDDWQLAARRWQQAIELMKNVPDNSSNYSQVKKKIVEYKRNFAQAQQKAGISISVSSAAPNLGKKPKDLAVNSALPKPHNKIENLVTNKNPGVFQIPIKYRAGGTAVIDVTFNNNQTFEMIVDTGASSTVITQKMAVDLGVMPEDTVKADTPSAKGVEFARGKVKSMEAGGLQVNDIKVAISPELDLGLLGHDFFSNYDIMIKQNVVEFHTR